MTFQSSLHVEPSALNKANLAFLFVYRCFSPVSSNRLKLKENITLRS